MAYDESNIKSLSSLEHIRLRPGMYIGRLGNGSHPDDGIYVLLKEVVDNSVDEFTMHFGSRIDITVLEDTVSVRDYGRGIPLGKVVECVSVINTGAKYDSEAFQFSVGLNGVGTKAVNALSSAFLVRSYREGKYVEAEFERGVLKRKKEGIAEMSGEIDKMIREGIIEGERRGLEKGRNEGRNEGRMETARNLIANGTVPLETIAECSGLSLEEVESMRNSIHA